MNWLLIVVLVFLGWNIFNGYRKGLLLSLYSIAKWILIMAFVAIASPLIGEVLTSLTPLPAKLESVCDDYLEKTMNKALKKEGASPDVVEGILVLPPEFAELSEKLPEPVMKKLLNVKEQADGLADVSGTRQLLSKKLASLMVRGIAVVIALIIGGLLFTLVGRMLDLVTKIPVLHGLNHTLGLLGGALVGMLWVWAFLAAAALLSATSLGRFVTPYITESKVLSWLCENNVLLSLFMR